MESFENLEAAFKEFLVDTRKQIQAALPEEAGFTLSAVGPNVICALLGALDEVFPSDDFIRATILASISEESEVQDAPAWRKQIIDRTPRAEVPIKP